MSDLLLEIIKHLDLLLCILLVTGILHQGKIIGKLVDCIKYFLSDYKQKTQQADEAIDAFIARHETNTRDDNPPPPYF